MTTWKQKRGQLAEASKRLQVGDPELEELRQEMKVLRAEERIAQIVAQAPPLSDEQRERICALLRAGGAA